MKIPTCAIVAILGLIVLWFIAIGCQQQNGPGATTQPVVVTTTLDPQAVKFFADLAVNDALLYVASDPKLQKYVDAALKAKADLDNADPAAPTYQKYVKAVNDATFDLILHAGKVKAAKKAVSQAAVSPGIVITKITVPAK